MQYGNYFIFLFYLNYFKFKSYYVVWKLATIGIIRPIFVSLNRTMQYGNRCWLTQQQTINHGLNRTMQYGNVNLGQLCFSRVIKFKSYYVVWKPSRGGQSRTRKQQSLNRTMQYGNYHQARYRVEEYICLNRTMQYGNLRH